MSRLYFKKSVTLEPKELHRLFVCLGDTLWPNEMREKDRAYLDRVLKELFNRDTAYAVRLAEQGYNNYLEAEDFNWRNRNND